MTIVFQFDTDEEEDYAELFEDKLAAFLASDRIKHNGKYYKITSKIFDYTHLEEELTVIAELERNISF